MNNNRQIKQSDEVILRQHGYLLFNVAGNSSIIGTGQFSKVRVVQCIANNEKRAVKIIDRLNTTKEYRVKFLPREIDIGPRLQHPNICRIFHQFSYGNKVYMIMELAERGDLLSYLQKTGALSNIIAASFMLQLLNAVQYMHNQHVAHRDLKLENVLITNEWTLIISDFGFCRQIGPDELSRTYCGSKCYTAPEIIKSEPYSPFKSDVWSLGVIAFILVTGRMPFSQSEQQNNATFVAAQRSRHYQCSPQWNVSTECRSTIDQMLTFEWQQRPSIADIMGTSSWLQNAKLYQSVQPR